MMISRDLADVEAFDLPALPAAGRAHSHPLGPRDASPRSLFDVIRDTRRFTVTDEHLRLLRRAHVTWVDAEFGAPEIDGKRPYGNSDVYSDIAEILGIPEDEWFDGEFRPVPRGRVAVPAVARGDRRRAPDRPGHGRVPARRYVCEGGWGGTWRRAKTRPTPRFRRTRRPRRRAADRVIAPAPASRAARITGISVSRMTTETTAFTSGSCWPEPDRAEDPQRQRVLRARGEHGDDDLVEGQREGEQRAGDQRGRQPAAA